MATRDKTNTKVIDPICGMEVDSEKAQWRSDYNGCTYFFCADGCRRAFEANPEKYAYKGITHKHFKWWYNYLDRLGKTTNGKSMTCCH
jgi:YHS domain-containing protein